jgi:hypothetical protein
MGDKTSAKITAGIRKLVTKDNEVLSAYVKSTDEGKATMVVTLYESGLDIEDVLLNGTVEETKGIVIVPEDGSDVVICSVDGSGEYMLVRASKVAKVLIDVPEIALKCDKVVINDGDNDGLVVLKKLNDNLDKLKKYIKNTLEPAIGNGFTAVGASTAANGGNGKTAFDAATSSQQISFENMENTKVKH